MMRLVSYNIHKGIGGTDRRYDLGRIIEVLVALEADFLCLQEVTIDLPRTSRHDQADILTERFRPMFATFQQNVHWKVGGYGNLVLSRWPLLEHHRISLQFGQKKPRGAQLIVAETPSGPLRVTNWHLGLSEGERHWQVHRLLTHPMFHSTAEHPTLLCGDFNDWRNTLGCAAAPEGIHPSNVSSRPVPLIPCGDACDVARQSISLREDCHQVGTSQQHTPIATRVRPPATCGRFSNDLVNRLVALSGIAIPHPR